MGVAVRLKRTKQCAKCPWRKDVNPTDIPNGYCPTKHAALDKTIAKGDALAQLETLRSGVLPIMACHETGDAHCVGWLANQLGPGNNIALRLAMSNCENLDKLKLVGKQHERFEDTLPK
jgi:hypothetical protein